MNNETRTGTLRWAGKTHHVRHRNYVREGLGGKEDPFKEQLREWVIGSEDFLRRMVALAGGNDDRRHRSVSRRLRVVSVGEIILATANAHGVDPSQYAAFRSQAAGRDMAAWLCRQWTGATLAELGPFFGLHGTDSVSNLVRRTETRQSESPKWRRIAKQVETELGMKTERKA